MKRHKNISREVNRSYLNECKGTNAENASDHCDRISNGRRKCSIN